MDYISTKRCKDCTVSWELIVECDMHDGQCEECCECANCLMCSVNNLPENICSHGLCVECREDIPCIECSIEKAEHYNDK